MSSNFYHTITYLLFFRYNVCRLKIEIKSTEDTKGEPKHQILCDYIISRDNAINYAYLWSNRRKSIKKQQWNRGLIYVQIGQWSQSIFAMCFNWSIVKRLRFNYFWLLQRTMQTKLKTKSKTTKRKCFERNEVSLKTIKEFTQKKTLDKRVAFFASEYSLILSPTSRSHCLCSRLVFVYRNETHVCWLGTSPCLQLLKSNGLHTRTQRYMPQPWECV